MPERVTVANWSGRSAEAIVAVRRRAERRGGFAILNLETAKHQKPGKPGQTTTGSGKARPGIVCDEAGAVGQERGSPGRANLLEQALARENMILAWYRVKRNGGSAGVDGLTIQDTAAQLKVAWPGIKESLLESAYRPSPVRRVEIPKPGGGVRELGIPTVTDRLIQQALLQVLQPLIDSTFSEHSYGFRPGRRAHSAVLAAQRYVQEGYQVVVDVDLETFFDRVNHDILMERLSRRVDDKAVLRLIRRYLTAGIMDNGVVMERYKGTPQGGPLSPLLANVLLDEVDRELEKRGHRFARYADDCNVYVCSQKAGERVLAGLRKLYARLRLKVNEAKTAVGSVFGRKFLGYSLWLTREGQVKRTIARKAEAAFKQRVRQITRRTVGCSMEDVVESLRRYVLGWKGYFQLEQKRWKFRTLDKWIRHRLRALQLKHWRRGTTAFRKLVAMGASPEVASQAAGNIRSWWRSSQRGLHRVLTIAYFDRLGVPRLS